MTDLQDPPQDQAPRYAVYWAPDDPHPLWQAGCAWLGRDPGAGRPLTGPARAHVHEPWRYGFHATLKAPMRLAPGCQPDDLYGAVAELARRLPAFPMPRLQVDWLDRFLALRPVQPLDERGPLQQLANACVTQLDSLRAPHSDAERARRTQAPLDELGLDLLLRWGYPHVLQRWRFHMTLSDRFEDSSAGAAQTLLREARDAFALALRAPLAATSVCVFEQPAPGQVFALTRRFALQR